MEYNYIFIHSNLTYYYCARSVSTMFFPCLFFFFFVFLILLTLPSNWSAFASLHSLIFRNAWRFSYFHVIDRDQYRRCSTRSGLSTLPSSSTFIEVHRRTWVCFKATNFFLSHDIRALKK